MPEQVFARSACARRAWPRSRSAVSNRRFPFSSSSWPRNRRLGRAGEVPDGVRELLAFGLALMERVDSGAGKPTALVLVPRASWRPQVTEELARRGRRSLRIEAVYGGVPLGRQATVHGRRRPRRHARTPEGPRRAAAGRARGDRLLVLDEADRMLEWVSSPRSMHRAAASQKPSDDVLLGDPGRSGRPTRPRIHARARPVRGSAARARHRVSVVDHAFVAVTASDKLDVLVDHLEASDGLALVFVRTKRGADRLARRLSQRDVPAAAMHGDMVQSRRRADPRPIPVRPRARARRDGARRTRSRSS